MDDIELIDRQLIHEGYCLRYYADTVKVPDGENQTWDFIEHKFDAAAVLPILPDGKILMVRQMRPAVGRYTWEIPAGKKDAEDGDPIICAKRELKEETGCASDDISFLFSYRCAPAYCSETVTVYVAKNVHKVGEQELDEAEFISCKAFDLDELLDMISKGTLEDGKSVAAIFAARDIIKNNK